MARFEEVQMAIAESAKNYLDIYNMQVLIEQFTLDRRRQVFSDTAQYGTAISSIGNRVFCL